MTNPDYTALAVLNDCSGSMDVIRVDAEGGLNNLIRDQRTVPGKCTIRMAEFNNNYRLVYPSTDIHDAPMYSLTPRGGTALLDAMGQLITEFGAELAAMDEVNRPGHVTVIIQTDGQENCSREWTRDRVFDLITHQRETYNWDFVFLAANQDAIAVGASFGTAAGSSLTYGATSDGVTSAFRSASSYIARSRSGLDTGFSDQDRSDATAT